MAAYPDRDLLLKALEESKQAAFSEQMVLGWSAQIIADRTNYSQIEASYS